jgi:hypothetical protein
MVRVSIDIVFFKNELFRMSVSVLRTIELEALQIFKAVVDFGGKRVTGGALEGPNAEFSPRFTSAKSQFCLRACLKRLMPERGD